MQRHVVLAVVTFAASAVTAAAQSPALGEPKLTVLAGIGPATAGLGLQAELYFAHGRVSAFGGFGYLPEYEDDDSVSASGAGVTGGLRGYTPGRVHRGFLEVAYGRIGAEQAPEGFPQEDLSLAYGPAVQAGWQMARPGGFTLVLSVGVGHISGNDFAESETSFIAFIGLGRTWRRK